jgi:hypothetical protein
MAIHHRGGAEILSCFFAAAHQRNYSFGWERKRFIISRALSEIKNGDNIKK